MVRKILPFVLLTFSFSVYSQSKVTISASKNQMAETGSIDVVATLDSASSQDALINFKVSGTATTNVDYSMAFTTKGTASTVAGGNGSGSASDQLNYPSDVSVDSAGNVYVLDRSNWRIQKWAPGADTGITVTTFNSDFNNFFVDDSGNIYASDESGNRVQKWSPGSTGWTTVAGGNGQGSNANQLNNPKGIYVDDSGNLYIADWQNHRVQKWAPGATEGVTVAGGNGNGSAANQLYYPADVSVDNQGNIYVLDYDNYRIQRWAPNAKTGTTVTSLGSWSEHFYVDQAGNIYCSDQNNYRIQKWSPGMVGWTTVAGGNGMGFNANQLNNPQGLFVDKTGNIFIADQQNHRVQKIQEAPQIFIKAGDTQGKITFQGIDDNNDEDDETIQLTPTSVSNCVLNNYDTILMTIIDDDDPPVVSFHLSNDRISENSPTDVTLKASLSETSGKEIDIAFKMGGSAVQNTDYTLSSDTIRILPGDSTGTLTVSTKGLDDDAVEPLDSIVFNVDTITHATPASKRIPLYLVSDDNPTLTYSVQNTSFVENDSVAVVATLNAPASKDAIVDFSLSGTAINNSDYTIDFAGKGIGETVAGGNGLGSNPNQLYYPNDISIDSNENIYILQPNNSRIIKWEPGADTGTTAASIYYWSSNFYVDPIGNIYVSEENEHRIQKWTPGGTEWKTVAGGNGQGANADQLNNPRGIFVDKDGNIYIADQQNHRVQKWAPNASKGTTVAGGNGRGSQANQLNYPSDVSVDAQGNVYVLDNNNHRIQKWAPGATEGVTVVKYNNDYQRFFVDSSGSIFCTDEFNNRIQEWAPGSNKWTTVAGGNGVGTNANQLNEPRGICLDKDGNLYVADYNNHRIQKFPGTPRLVVKAGETQGKMTIKGIDDFVNEYDESIILTPKNHSNCILQNTDTIDLTITDNDNQPAVSFSFSKNKIEENSSSDVILTATSSYVSAKDIYIHFKMGGSAVDSIDYALSSHAINIPAGDTTGTLSISTRGLDDTIVEQMDSIVFNVDTITNAQAVKDRATLFLESDDNPTVTLNPSATSMAENDSLTVTAVLNAASSRDAVVNFDISGTATLNKDYTVDFPTKGTASTVAGGNGSGSASNQLNYPNDVSVDSAGNIYILDRNNRRIQKWEPGVDTGITVTTFSSDYNSFFVDNSGNIYASDGSGNRVQEWSPGSTGWTTVAGGNGRGANANQLDYPSGIYVDDSGNIYIADWENHRVQKWAPGATEGVTVAGGNGNGSAANQLYYPADVSVDNYGNIYVLDHNNFRIQKWAPNAKTGTTVTSLGFWSEHFYVDQTGNIYCSDQNNYRVQKWTPGTTGWITVAGGNGMGSNANQLGNPQGLFVDKDGNIFIADYDNQRIQKIQESPQIVVKAGNTEGKLTLKGIDDNDNDEGDETIILNTQSSLNAKMANNQPLTLTITDFQEPNVSVTVSKDTITENDSLVVTASLDAASRKDASINFKLSGTATYNADYLAEFSTKGVATTVAGGNGEGRAANQLSYPQDVFVDSLNNIYVLEQYRISKWAAGANKGTVVTSSDYNWDGSFFIDHSGNIYVSYPNNHYVKEWNASNKKWTIVAGGNGQGNNANQLNYPRGIYVDNAGNIYVADEQNNRIQKWAPGATKGVTVAGGNGHGSAANQLSDPRDVSVDSDGNIYVLDGDNYRIQKWIPGATAGTTVTKLGFWCSHFFIDASNNIYVTGPNNNNIKEWSPGTKQWLTVGGGNGIGSNANQLNEPQGIYVDNDGDVYVADKRNHRVQKFQELPQILIKAGNTEGKMTIKGIDDQANENSESITLVPVNITNCSLNGNDTLNLIIADNDPLPEVTLNFSQKTIEEDAKTPVTLTAKVNHVSGRNILIAFKVSGDAKATTQYTISSDTIKIPAGDSTGTLSVSTAGLDDTLVDIMRHIVFKVDTAVNAVIASGYTSDTLYYESNDNPTATFSATADTIAEHQSLEIEATLNAPSSRNALIDFGFSGTATYDKDYTVDFPTKGQVTTVAGGNGQGYSGNKLSFPHDVFVDSLNNIYILNDNYISKWAAGADSGVRVTNSNYNWQGSLFVDQTGTIYVSYPDENNVRKWNSSDSTWTIVAGGNGQGNNANQLSHPMGIYVDKAGNIYVADQQNNRVQKWAPGATKGVTVAGGNGQGYSNKQLSSPHDIFVDSLDDIYVLEENRITKWVSGADTGTVIANMNYNWNGSITVDPIGNVYISYPDNNGVVKEWNPSSSTWTTIAGGNGTGSNANQLNEPRGICMDKGGNIFVADSRNQRIQKVQEAPQILIKAGDTKGKITIQGIDDGIDGEGIETIKIKPGLLENVKTNASADFDIALLDNTKTLTLQENPFIGLSKGAVAWGDFDRDGDLDVAVMGTSLATGAVTAIYENKNGKFVNTNSNLARLYNGDISWVDVNKDGWIDLVVSGYGSNGPETKLYLNEKGKYFKPTDDYGLPQLYNSKMAWGDLDNDGDIDLAISGLDEKDQFKFYICYRVDGQNKFVPDPVTVNYNQSGSGKWQGFINGDMKIADVDLDGDNDIVFNGETKTGNPTGEIIYNSYIDSTATKKNITNYDTYHEYHDFDNLRLKNSTIAVARVNHYSKKAMTIFTSGEDANGNIKLSAFVPGNGNIDLNNRIFPKLKNGDIAIADFDNNGLNDIVFTGENKAGEPTTKLFYQYSKGNFKEANIKLKGLRNSTAAWVDYDMDGDLDLFLTGIDKDGTAKTLLYKADVANKKNTPPAKITGLTVTDLGNGRVRFSWDVPSDDFATNLGYVLRLGKTPGGSELSNTESDSTGRRLITKPAPIYNNFYETQLDPGIYYWSVQAVDPGLKGGPFSDEASFTLTYAWKILNQGGIVDRRIQGVEDPVIKLADLDNDGDMDLIYASAKNDGGGTQLFKYDGKRLVPITSSNPLNYVQNVTDAEVGDVNGDGTPDILINNFSNDGNYNLKLFLSDTTQTGDSTQKVHYREADIGKGLYKAKGKIVDLNNDGQAEVVLLGLSSSYTSGTLRFYIYEYDTASSYTSPQFKKTDISDQLEPLNGATFDMGDVDNDQDFDLILSGFSNTNGLESFIYKNVTPIGGSYKFQKTSNQLVAVKDGTANLIDYDGDGDLDAVITGTSAAGDVFEIYENQLNEGNETWPRLNNLGLTPMRDSKVDLGDFNGDGYSDLLYSGVVQGEGEVTKLSEFDPATKSYKQSSFDVSDIINAEVEFGDIEGDGDLDFALSGESRAHKGQYLFRAYVNVRNQSAAVSTLMSSIQAINGFKETETGTENFSMNYPPSVPVPNPVKIIDSLSNAQGVPVEFSWKASTDDHTPVKGLTYALKVGTTPGGSQILSANANADGIRTTAGKGNAEHNLHWRLRLPKGTYYWSVQAVDASYAGSAFSKPVKFTTSVNTNSAPTDITLSDTTVDENAAIGTAVGTLSTVDPDAGDSHTYTLVSGDGDTDNGSFKISGDTLVTNKVFDYETKSSYSVRIQTDDGNGGTFSKSFTILINNLNDSNSAPTNIILSDTTVDENAPVGTAVGTLSSVDADSSDTHTYTLVSGNGDTDNSSFKISGDTLVTNEVFDYETKSSYSVRVQTDDGNGGTFSKSFTILINNLNEAPTNIVLSDTTVDENAAIGTAVGTLSTVDPDAGDSHTYTLVSGDGDTDNGSFKISGDTLVTNKVFDYETKSSYSVRIQTDDGNGGTFSKSFAILINNTTGVETFSSQVKTYPNPFTDKINIDIPATHPVHLRVMDSYGRVILWKLLTEKNNKIVFNNIHYGLYLVQIIDNSKIIYQTKIIKNNK